MSGSEFKKVIEIFGKNVADVAYETKMAPQTVYNFVNGIKVSRRTRSQLEEYARKLPSSQAGRAATG